MKLTLHQPFIITSRLMPGVRIGELEVHIMRTGHTDRFGKPRWEYRFDGPGIECSGNDLHCFGGVVEAMENLLVFLAHYADEWHLADDDERKDHVMPFDQALLEWAKRNESAIEAFVCDITDDSGSPRKELVEES